MYVHHVPLTSLAYYNPQDSWSSYRSVPLSHEPRTQDGQYEFAHLHVPDMYIQLYPDKIDINEAKQTGCYMKNHQTGSVLHFNIGLHR